MIRQQFNVPRTELELAECEFSGCPYCGEPIAVQPETRTIFHELPACPRYLLTLTSAQKFDVAVGKLEADTVRA